MQLTNYMNAWSVLREKFGKDRVQIGKTWYNPYNDEHILDIVMLGRNMVYKHKGDIKIGHSRNIGMYFMEKYPEYLL